jgi:hypothetical protein
MSLWKIVEKSVRPAAAMNACSGCSGDYEDPDRTTWEPDQESDDASGELEGAHAVDDQTRHTSFQDRARSMKSIRDEEGKWDG